MSEPKTTRLNNSNKKEISGRILTHRFKKEADTIIRRYRKLALDIYNDHYKPSTLQKMQELPAGWLPEVTSFAVSFATDFSRLYFDGPSLSDEYRYGARFNSPDKNTTMIMLHKDTHNAIEVYDANHPFTTEYRELQNLAKDFKKSLADGYSNIQVGFRLSTTVEGLKSKWPEIAPFLGDLDKSTIILPAVQIADLNSFLELPVIE